MIPRGNWILLALLILLSISFLFHFKNVKFIYKTYFIVDRLSYCYQKCVSLFERKICIGWAALRSYNVGSLWLPGLTIAGSLMISLHLFDDAKSFSSWWPFNRNKHFQNIFCSFKGKNGSMWSLALHDHSNILQQLFAISRSTLFDIGQKHCPTS